MYLWTTKKKKMVFRGISNNHLKVYVDGAFACHPDGKSHTGLVVQYGESVVMCQSKKQKICTKDSTEAEIVSVSDEVPEIEWVKEYLLGQGAVISSTTLYQDNKSCIMILEDPGIGRLRTRYIRARVGLANEFVLLRGEAKIKYIPTKLMLADGMTKPLGGGDFACFEGRIMNLMTDEEFRSAMIPDEGAENAGKNNQPGWRGNNKNVLCAANFIDEDFHLRGKMIEENVGVVKRKMGMDCPPKKHRFPHESVFNPKALDHRSLTEIRKFVAQGHGVAARCTEICEESNGEKGKSQNNPANPPELGRKGLTWMVVESPGAAEVRKAQVSIDKGRNENFGMDSRRNSPRKENLRKKQASVGDETSGGCRVGNEVFRPRVWCCNSRRFKSYGDSKFLIFDDVDNSNERFEMVNSERREAAKAQESENYEFRERKLKVSAKIDTGKGVGRYTHL